jgi:hypothetical protein
MADDRGNPHPLVDLVVERLVPGTGERWALRADTERVLVGALSKLKDEPMRADAVLALFHAALTLSDEEGSPGAAGVILKVLHAVRGELRLDAVGPGPLGRQLEAGLDRVLKKAPRIGAPAPPGSLKASDLAPRSKITKP